MDTQNITLFFDVQLENMWKTVKKLIIMFWVMIHCFFFFLKETGELKKMYKHIFQCISRNWKQLFPVLMLYYLCLSIDVTILENHPTSYGF